MENHEAKELDRLVERLRKRYPTIPPDMIRREVERLHGQYDGVRVRDFLSILVEREARESLRATGRADRSGAR